MKKTKLLQNNISFFFATLLISWAIFVFPCFSQAGKDLSQEEKVQRSQSYYEEGKKLLADGKYAEADKAFKNAQQLLSGTSSSASFMPLEETPLATAPSGPSITEKAFAASLKGSSQEAIALYLEAIEASEGDANLYYNTAIEYLKTNQFRKASEFFKKAILLNPKDTNAYYNLGVLYESYLSDKRQALHYYSQYLKLAPSKDTQEIKEWIRQIKKELRVK